MIAFSASDLFVTLTSPFPNRSIHFPYPCAHFLLQHTVDVGKSSEQEPRAPAAFLLKRHYLQELCTQVTWGQLLTAVILGSVGHDFGFLIGSPKEFFPVYCICVAQVSVAGNDHISIAYFLEGTQSQGCDVQANDRKRKLTAEWERRRIALSMTVGTIRHPTILFFWAT